mmetsp:Transcript_9196/g.12651  ORF Transcript_9196/g.12651 Transcript_9196/m.12651 type:complete len:100 (+) Transcript_9196:1189-1488(+)
MPRVKPFFVNDAAAKASGQIWCSRPSPPPFLVEIPSVPPSYGLVFIVVALKEEEEEDGEKGDAAAAAAKDEDDEATGVGGGGLGLRNRVSFDVLVFESA